MEKWFRGGEQGMELWGFFSFSIFIYYSGLPLRDILSFKHYRKMDFLCAKMGAELSGSVASWLAACCEHKDWLVWLLNALLMCTMWQLSVQFRYNCFNHLKLFLMSYFVIYSCANFILLYIFFKMLMVVFLRWGGVAKGTNYNNEEVIFLISNFF